MQKNGFRIDQALPINNTLDVATFLPFRRFDQISKIVLFRTNPIQNPPRSQHHFSFAVWIHLALSIQPYWAISNNWCNPLGYSSRWVSSHIFLDGEHSGRQLMRLEFGSTVPGRSPKGSRRGLAARWIVREIFLSVNQSPWQLEIEGVRLSDWKRSVGDSREVPWWVENFQGCSR